MSGVLKPRFATHDRVTFSGPTAKVDHGLDSGPSLTLSVASQSSKAGGSGAQVTSLEKAGLSLNEPLGLAVKTQMHRSLAPAAMGDAKPRPRNGASVRKIVPLDPLGSPSVAPSVGSTSPSTSPPPLIRTLSPIKDPKARLLKNDSAATPRLPQHTIATSTSTRLDPVRPGSPEHSPGKQVTAEQAAKFVAGLDDASGPVGSYSPRTQMLMRARQNRDGIAKKNKRSKLSRNATGENKEDEAPPASPPPKGEKDDGPPTRLKLTKQTIDAIVNAREPVAKFGQRVPKEVMQ